MASMRRGMRSERWIPKAVYSSSRYPIPIPRTKRPPDMASRVAQVSATSTGLRRGIRSTVAAISMPSASAVSLARRGMMALIWYGWAEVVLAGTYHVEAGFAGEAGLFGGLGDALRDRLTRPGAGR